MRRRWSAKSPRFRIRRNAAGATCCAPRRPRATLPPCWRWPAGWSRRATTSSSSPRRTTATRSPRPARPSCPLPTSTTRTTSWWRIPNASRRPNAGCEGSRTTCVASSSVRSQGSAATCERSSPSGRPMRSSWTPCSSARCRWRLARAAQRPVLACVGVMPYPARSRDTAPFGVALQPGSGLPARARNLVLNWITEHGALADIQRFARHRLAEAGVERRGTLPRLLHRPPAQSGGRLFAGDRGRLRVPALGPRTLGALRRPDPRPAHRGLRRTAVVGRAGRRTAGRPRDPRDAGQR